jgi:hypothetical protein
LGVEPSEIGKLSTRYREEVGASIKNPFPEGERFKAPMIPEAAIRTAVVPPKPTPKAAPARESTDLKSQLVKQALELKKKKKSK